MEILRPGVDASWARRRAYEVIFGHATTAGRAFDIGLIIAILASVAAVVLESVAEIRAAHGPLLRGMEWGFTILFSVEYVLRLTCVSSPIRYARSFFGIVDLVAVLPTYLSVLVPGAQYLLVVRLFRILRVFRVLKLVPYLVEAQVLMRALRSSRRKIMVFLLTVMILVVILGSLMYFVEGSDNGFTSIPRAVYWAIVTMTTVGYGDIAPGTPMGQALAAVVMIIGYGIIAVPTGIVTAEMVRTHRDISRQACRRCSGEGHDPDATFCKFCGEPL